MRNVYRLRILLSGAERVSYPLKLFRAAHLLASIGLQRVNEVSSLTVTCKSYTAKTAS